LSGTVAIKCEATNIRYVFANMYETYRFTVCVTYKCVTHRNIVILGIFSGILDFAFIIK